MLMAQQYIDFYKSYQQDIKSHSAILLNAFRDEAFAKFEKLGFPTAKLEDYKYTDMKEPLTVDYGLNINHLPIPVNPYKVFKCDVPGIRSYLYFVVNEVFYPVTSTSNQQFPEGVIIDSLMGASEKYPELVEKYIGKLSREKNDGWIAFNETFAQDGFFMYIPKNVKLKKPVQLVNILHSNVDLMANTRNLIIIEEGGEAQLLVCDHTMDNVKFFSNRLTEIFVGENAHYEHYHLENVHQQTTNVSTLLVNQQTSSKVLANIITLHNGITRNSIEVNIDGEFCETLLTGMVIGDKTQTVDNFTSIVHKKPNSQSNELFKYILDENSKGAFSGKIYVAPHAQKTFAYQNNRNILLSKNARMRSKPQLEIYADDVKCSHGATIGQLDELAKFYMQSRGISEAEARFLLMFAFTNDVIENIKIEALKGRMRLLIEKRLRGKLAYCEGCMI
ncbi:MAG TPA: Fe-S cluster assembly protein SufD [Paludibacteraceae bacterium]|nr:Fe-S cluster assembly protein SufD [Paludibacteraceae bacterium]HPO67409.1 Fe-S cluster assembly protein SufD [Paludibacteraceae bacterium]